eukprot:6385623-Alexandrium_andersonii.AAC.1
MATSTACGLGSARRSNRGCSLLRGSLCPGLPPGLAAAPVDSGCAPARPREGQLVMPQLASTKGCSRRAPGPRAFWSLLRRSLTWQTG